MIMIAWILWALKIAGLTTLSYNFLIVLTIVLLLVSTVLSKICDYLKSKQSDNILEKAGEGTKSDSESILTLLMLIYKKLK